MCVVYQTCIPTTNSREKCLLQSPRVEANIPAYVTGIPETHSLWCITFHLNKLCGQNDRHRRQVNTQRHFHNPTSHSLRSSDKSESNDCHFVTNGSLQTKMSTFYFTFNSWDRKKMLVFTSITQYSMGRGGGKFFVCLFVCFVYSVFWNE